MNRLIFLTGGAPPSLVSRSPRCCAAAEEMLPGCSDNQDSLDLLVFMYANNKQAHQYSLLSGSGGRTVDLNERCIITIPAGRWDTSERR